MADGLTSPININGSIVRYITGTNSGTAAGSANYIRYGNVVHCFGYSDSISTTAGGATTKTVVFPVTYKAAPIVSISTGELVTAAAQLTYLENGTIATTGFTGTIYNFGGANGSAKWTWWAIGTV